MISISSTARVTKRNSLEWSRELAIFGDSRPYLVFRCGWCLLHSFSSFYLFHQIILTRFSHWASGSKKVLLSLRNQVLAVGGRDGCREGFPPLGFRWLWKLLPMFILIWCFMGMKNGETEIQDSGLWKWWCLLCSKTGAVPRGLAFHTLLLLHPKPRFYIVSAVLLQTVINSCTNTVRTGEPSTR